MQYAETVALSLEDNMKDVLYCSCYGYAIVQEELIDNNHRGRAAAMNFKWLNFKHLRLSGGWLKGAKLRRYSYSSHKYL